MDIAREPLRFGDWRGTALLLALGLVLVFAVDAMALELSKPLVAWIRSLTGSEGPPPLRGGAAPGSVIVRLLFYSPVCVLLAQFFALREGRGVRVRLGLVPSVLAWRELGLVLVAYVALQVVVVGALLALGIPPAITQSAQRYSAWLALINATHGDALILLILVTGGIAPGFELLFRGWLLRGLLPRTTPAFAVVAVGIVAVAGRLPVPMLASLPMSLFPSWLCWRARSVWPSLQVAALHNGLAFVAYPAAIFAGLMPPSRLPRLPLILGVLAGLAVFALCLRALQRGAVAVPARPETDAGSTPTA